jgi:hypothetical protein
MLSLQGNGLLSPETNFKVNYRLHVARMGKRRGSSRVLLGNLTERDRFENAGVDGWIILRWIFRKWGGAMDEIYLAQDRDRWQALVNAVMNIWVP